MDVTVVAGAGHLAIRASGPMTAGSATGLRDALLSASAEQPRGLVCDLTGAEATPEGLAVLHEVADRVADWPSVPIALVASEPGLVAQLDALGLPARLPVVSDAALAGAALRRSPRLLRAATDLPCSVEAPGAARAFVAASLQRWHVDGIVEGARWVVSELVTNAVVHAGTDLTVRVHLAGHRVGLAVADRGRTGPVRTGEGHGLRVVEQLSRRWGTLPRLGAGSVVWALLDVDVPAAAVLPEQAVRA